jgi:hypothetical protein
MIIERTNKEVIIRLPPDVDTAGLEELINSLIRKEADARRNQKMALLKEASADPLFLADISEVQRDFDHIDDETL